MCIIRQKSSSSTVVSTENGRKKIIEGAATRQDEVLLRLKSLAIDQHFCYHMDNQCWKKDTLKKTIDKIKVKEKIMFCLAETLAIFNEFKFSYANIDYASVSCMLVSM